MYTVMYMYTVLCMAYTSDVQLHYPEGYIFIKRTGPVGILTHYVQYVNLTQYRFYFAMMHVKCNVVIIQFKQNTQKSILK